MSNEPIVAADGRAVTFRISISIRKRGGRKLVLAPDGTSDKWAAPGRRVDNAMVKAIARAFRWREMLENGTHATIAEIADAEKINEFLRGARAAPDPIGTGRRRGDFGWTAAGRIHLARADAAVLSGLAQTASFVTPVRGD